MDPRKVQDFRNPSGLMILRNGLLEIEAIEQLPLVPIEPSHHRSISQKPTSPPRNHDSAISQMTFATKSATTGLMRRKKSQAPYSVAPPFRLLPMHGKVV
jgi:hypothetical protein